MSPAIRAVLRGARVGGSSAARWQSAASAGNPIGRSPSSSTLCRNMTHNTTNPVGDTYQPNEFPTRYVAWGGRT